ncbi:carboxypeptidase regulatory-like domain-containing protein, partial [candidate division KSB1 bacterium]|nr:carboxypeptidase regulatory-like domain-containing protein [candidate division KSB1 bacterium]
DDGSTATGVLTFNVTITPPLIQGKVTDKASGNPIPNAVVAAVPKEGEEIFSFTDTNGDYKMAAEPGSYKVMAFEFINSEHMPSDSVDVTVGAGQSVTQNFQLEKYKAFVEGTLKKENGTAVPGIRVMGGNIESEDFTMATSTAEGYYKIGVVPGRVAVMVSSMFNMDVWPADYYVDPEADTLDVANGQTQTRNFVFKQHTSFITGKCTADGQPLPGVEINAMTFDMTGLAYYTTFSQQDGTYRLGVKPGNITMMSATKDGYQVVMPENGMYMGIQVNPNQTVTGMDFGLTMAEAGNSISGRVTFTNGTPASNVYVVAENWNDDELGKSFLTTFTNGNGEYTFMPELTDEWKVGVFKQGYSSEPAMRYETLWLGPVTGADFVLSEGTSVSALADGLLPQEFYLEQNYPNPFKPGFNTSMTKIGFFLAEPAQTDIMIYNVIGQLVYQTNKGTLTPGKHSVTWNGRDLNGELVPTGMYFYHVKAGDRVLNKRMIVIR